MKLLKICFASLLLAIVFSACEVQSTSNVVDIVKGTPSNADSVLPHKFKNYQKADSAKEAGEEHVVPVFKR